MGNSLPAKPVLLGKSLKWLRENRKETISEVAGAVEIDDKLLQDYENGQQIPSEDILELIFNHFEISGEQALRLRRLAGYPVVDTNPELNGINLVKMPVVMLGMDQRVVYSDGAHIEVNPEGVVVTFMQGHDPNVPVSRVGMSHEQAEKVMKTLEQALLRAKYTSGPPELPPNVSRDANEASGESKKSQ